MKYADWDPTACDTKGLGLPERQNWIVAPCDGEWIDTDLTDDGERVISQETWDALPPFGGTP